VDGIGSKIPGATCAATDCISDSLGNSSIFHIAQVVTVSRGEVSLLPCLTIFFRSHTLHHHNQQHSWTLCAQSTITRLLNAPYFAPVIRWGRVNCRSRHRLANSYANAQSKRYSSFALEGFMHVHLIELTGTSSLAPGVDFLGGGPEYFKFIPLTWQDNELMPVLMAKPAE
jgi:hypothetical protein